MSHIHPSELHGSHLGKRVRVTQPHRVVQGYLTEVHHSASLIQTRALCEAAESFATGEVETRLEVGDVRIDCTRLTATTVEVLS
jgi:hypothetical protein